MLIWNLSSECQISTFFSVIIDSQSILNFTLKFCVHIFVSPSVPTQSCLLGRLLLYLRQYCQKMFQLHSSCVFPYEELFQSCLTTVEADQKDSGSAFSLLSGAFYTKPFLHSCARLILHSPETFVGALLENLKTAKSTVLKKDDWTTGFYYFNFHVIKIAYKTLTYSPLIAHL